MTKVQLIVLGTAAVFVISSGMLDTASQSPTALVERQAWQRAGTLPQGGSNDADRGNFGVSTDPVLALKRERRAAPGRTKGEAPLMSPDTARTVLFSRGPSAPIPPPRSESETEMTPEIQGLAWGLRGDPQLIYEFVRNHIEYAPIYGSVKGATMTLLDRKGNDFDQTSLFIALMRASGYTADYIYGQIQLTAEEVSNWLGVPPDPDVVGRLLGSGGVPAMIWVYPSGDLAAVDLDHVWAKATIDESEYVFDPSFKTYAYAEGVELPTVLGYDQATFLGRATAGAVIDPNYVQNVNVANVRADLASYAANLVSHIKTSLPGARLADVIGGRDIEPSEGEPFQTSLPYELSRDHEWTDVPASFKVYLRIQYRGIDENLASSEIYGKRLTLTQNPSNQPEFRLDGTLLATGNPTTPGTYNQISLSVDHPYAANGGTYGDQQFSTDIKAGGSYVIVNSWAGTGRRIIERHRRMLKENMAAGGANDSEPVLGETLSMIALTWLAETSRAEELADTIADTTTIAHHSLGLCGQTDSPYIDMPMCFVSVISHEEDDAKENACFFAQSGISSAFEWGVVEQLQPFGAVSTVKLIDISNGKGDKIFDADSSNWGAVKPQLVNYDSYSEIPTVEAYIYGGWRVILPQDGDLNQDDWYGIGFLAITPDEQQIGHIISGGLSGGEGTTAGDADPGEAGDSAEEGNQESDHDTSDEPIDLVAGSYLYEHTDMTLGNGAFPFGMRFKRYYSSGSRLNDGPIGLGWTHNFTITATADSDGFQGMGEDSPIDAAAAIAELYVTTDILTGSKTPTRLVIATVSHRWYVDQLINNVVTVTEPGNARQFVRLSDDTYHPPPGNADLLTEKVDGSYLVRTKHGELLDFDTEGKLSTWKDRNNNTATFSYAAGKLQTVDNGLSRSFSFTYDGERLSQISDNAGRTTGYQHDAAGNLTTVTDCNDNDTTFEYDIDGRMTRIYYPANPANPFVTNTYDALDKVVTQANANGHTYTYHFSGYRAEEIDPLANSQAWHFDYQGKTIRETDQLGNETTHTHDGEGRLTQTVFPEGNSAEYAYDANHNRTRRTVNPKPGSVDPPIVEQYEYDPTFNQVVTYIDPLSRTTTSTYDGNGNLVRIDQPEVNGEVPQTHFTYNARGQVESRTDAEGRTIAYTYDGTTGDQLSVTTNPGGLNLATAMGYDAVGNMTAKTDPRDHTTVFQYDAMRRLTQVTAPPPLSYVTKFAYDADGHLTSTQRQTDDPLEPWQIVTSTYTLSGKKQTVTDPQGHVTTYQYDDLDRLWKVTDAEARTTEYLYDYVGRVHRVIDALGHVSEEHGYTSNGLQESLTDPNGNTTTYGYDDFDRLENTTYPDTSFEAFSYGQDGNLTRKQTRAGQSIDYVYDDLNRLESKIVPGSNTIQYAYDLAGLLADVTDSNGTIHHDYDDARRLVRVTYPDGKTVEYGYDEAGNRVQLTYPDGYDVTYGYDPLNRMTDVYEANVTLLGHYEYDALSRRTILTYGNGVTTTYEYEIDDDLSTVLHEFADGPVTFAYTYDDSGNCISLSVDDDRFLYTPPAGLQSAYLTNTLNQYISVEGVPFAYDDNGNLTSDAVNTYSYDTQNRLTAAVTPEHLTTYGYDAFGRRIAKAVDGIATSQVYDGHRVLMQYGPSDELLRRYVFGRRIDEPLCVTHLDGTHYYHLDAVGSVVALSDGFGNVVDTYAYSPYGKIEEPSTSEDSYFYTGRECDVNTGLCYHRARHYAPRFGRFLQVDPLRWAGGPANLYSYVDNNPITWNDPFGLVKENEQARRLKKDLNTALKGREFERAGQIASELAQVLGVNVTISGAGSFHGAGLGWSISISADPFGTVTTSGGIGLGIGAGFAVTIGGSVGDAGPVYVQGTIAGGAGWGGQASGAIGVGGVAASAAGGWGISGGAALTIGGDIPLGDWW